MENVRARYEALIATRNTELSAHWTRYNVFGAIHAAVGVALLGAERNAVWMPRYTDEVMAGVGLVGVVLAVAWHLLATRGYDWLEFWNARLADLERRLGGTEFHQANQMVNGGGGMPIKCVAQLVPIVAAVAWAGVLLHGLRPAVWCYLR